MIPSPSPVPCPHCGTPTESGGFCCTGCGLAAALLRDAGLDRYYADRAGPAPRPGAPPRVDLEAKQDGRSAEVRFHVDGLSCAACVWVAEALVGRVPGVEAVFVSYGTSNATVRFDPERASPAEVVAPLQTVGWGIRAVGTPAPADRSWMIRVGLSAFAAMNIMLISASVYAGWLGGMSPSWRTLFSWWTLILATPVATWAALPFYRTAWAGLRTGRLHVDVPVSLGVLAMYAHGVWAALAGAEGYLDSMAMLVALLLGARVLEQGGRRRAAEAARSLGALAPTTARRLDDGVATEVPAATLRPGDRIVAGLGEELGADGVVVEGLAEVQLALLTGESTPRGVGPGDEVVAGGVVSAGNLVVVVTRVGADSLLGRMAARLADALDRPLPATLADRVAPAFTALTLAAAASATLGWAWASGPDAALNAGIAVLVVACPCALALAAPLSASAALGAAARGGLLVRSGGVLRTLARVDTVVFDKTGTLTEGVPCVVEADDATLRIAAGLERQSRHPIARAILAEAAHRGIALPSPRVVLERAGEGVVGEVDGERYGFGRGPGGALELRRAGALVGRIRLADRVRPEARATVSALREAGYRLLLLSGDDAEVVARIAAEVGIAEAFGGLRPEAKADRLAELRNAGATVLFVGDGVNDGPAIAAADVGVAMGEGAASTVQVADAVQVGHGLGAVAFGLRLARLAETTVRRASRRSLVYNAAAVAAAAGGLINPLVAALLMPLSSGLVIGGALRLGRAA